MVGEEDGGVGEELRQGLVRGPPGRRGGGEGEGQVGEREEARSEGMRERGRRRRMEVVARKHTEYSFLKPHSQPGSNKQDPDGTE